MRNAVISLILVFAVAVTSGCAGSSNAMQGALGGAGVGGAIGGLASTLIPGSSPVAQAIGTGGGALFGGTVGYLWGKKADTEQQRQQEEAAAKKVQSEQFAQYMERVRKETKLSVPIVVLIAGKGERVNTPSRLAEVLMPVQPGTDISVVCDTKAKDIILQDMKANGLSLKGVPGKVSGAPNRTIMLFQKYNVMAPMTAEQAAKLL